MGYQLQIDGPGVDVARGDNGVVSLDIQGRRPLRVAVKRNPQEVGELHTVAEVADADCLPGAFTLEIDGVMYQGWRYASGEKVHVRIAGRTYAVELPGFGDGSGSAAASHDEIRADMPGVIIAVHCVAGDAVHTGDKLLTLESMKLQVSLVAHRDAVIEKIHLAPEASFERGALLISLLPQTPAAGSAAVSSSPSPATRT